ncbi:zinc ribbon domain-containing protein [Noviherbaspirillum malthae]
MVLEGPAPYTSRTCSECGYTHSDNRHGERFCCLACGFEKWCR